MKEILLAAGVGALAGGLISYVLTPKAVAPTPSVTVKAKEPELPPGPTSTQMYGRPTRWESGYMGPTPQGIYPEAGVTEALYPYGEGHKITQLSPALFAESQEEIDTQTVGNTIVVD